MKNRKKLDLWKGISIFLLGLFLLFLVYPMFGLLKQAVVTPEGSFTLKEFDMEKVSELYARPEYKGKLRVEAGSKPCLSLKIRSRKNVINEAREFALAWGGCCAERNEA